VKSLEGLRERRDNILIDIKKEEEKKKWNRKDNWKNSNWIKKFKWTFAKKNRN
jgi:hypothetical protein